MNKEIGPDEHFLQFVLEEFEDSMDEEEPINDHAAIHEKKSTNGSSEYFQNFWNISPKKPETKESQLDFQHDIDKPRVKENKFGIKEVEKKTKLQISDIQEEKYQGGYAEDLEIFEIQNSNSQPTDIFQNQESAFSFFPNIKSTEIQNIGFKKQLDIMESCGYDIDQPTDVIRIKERFPHFQISQNESLIDSNSQFSNELLNTYLEECERFNYKKPNSQIIKTILNEDMENLQHLDFSENFLSCKGIIPFLKILSTLKSLKKLDLQENGLNNNAFIELSKVINKSNLQELNVKGNSISKDVILSVQQKIDFKIKF